MTPDPAYWAANVAPLDDATLLRFMDACEARRDKYQVALDAALNEARRRNLIEKRPPIAGGQSVGRKL
jgi:hypothetical protein